MGVDADADARSWGRDRGGFLVSASCGVAGVAVGGVDHGDGAWVEVVDPVGDVGGVCGVVDGDRDRAECVWDGRDGHGWG